MSEDSDIHNLSTVIERVEHSGAGKTVSLAEIADAIGHGAFGALLLVPALIMVSPLSAIPGLSSLMGLVIALFAIQIVIGRDTLWLPDFLGERSLDRDRLLKATARLEKPSRFIDRLTYRRLAFLTEKPLNRLPAVVCLAASLIVPPFELVPMSASILGMAIALFALAMVTKDGLLILIGLAFVAGAGALGWTFMT